MKRDYFQETVRGGVRTSNGVSVVKRSVLLTTLRSGYISHDRVAAPVTLGIRMPRGPANSG